MERIIIAFLVLLLGVSFLNAQQGKVLKSLSMNIEILKDDVNFSAYRPPDTVRSGRPDAKFVWFDQEGSGRHQYVYFAFEFELETEADRAILNLFADSRYLLKVNGTTINWGPGRFYPEEIEHYFPVSSVWPVLYDVAKKEQVNYVNRFLTRELDSIGNTPRHNKITPYGAFYALGALYKMENAETAEFFMRKYWQNMVLDDNDCTWEDFGMRNGHGSKSHGWSGAPTWYLSTYTLGVQLGFPEPTDMSMVTIAPQSATIEWAKGVVPHPTGPVDVDWKIQGDHLFLNYKTTKGVEVVVKPKGRLSKKKLWVNGERNDD